jgi:hypothetical protein
LNLIIFEKNYKILNNEKSKISRRFILLKEFYLIPSDTSVNPVQPIPTDSLNRRRNITAPTVNEHIFKVCFLFPLATDFESEVSAPSREGNPSLELILVPDCDLPSE